MKTTMMAGPIAAAVSAFGAPAPTASPRAVLVKDSSVSTARNFANLENRSRSSDLVLFLTLEYKYKYKKGSRAVVVNYPSVSTANL